jgi:hypothetical protein
MPLYSSKGLDKNNHETRKKHKQYCNVLANCFVENF